MLIKNTLAPGLMERYWECLAQALTAAGHEKESVLLAKVVLMLASKLDDPTFLERVIEVASRDLQSNQSE